MAVTYLPPITRSSAELGASLLMEAVESGPAYARSGRYSTRWHIVRSAVDRIAEWRNGEIERTFTFWCGPVAHGFRTITTDEVPEGEPLCGTCYGRREGYDPDRPELLFTPVTHARPRVCPGSHSGFYADGDRYNRGTCLVCAEPVKLRACGGRWYGGANSWGPQLHGPGPGLIEPCEFHGWRELTKATDSNGQAVVACRCKCVEATQ